MPGQLLRLTNDAVRERVGDGRFFTDVVDVERDSRPRRFVALLCADRHRVTHAALASRGSRVATGKVRIRYDLVEELTPVLVSAMETGISPRLRGHLVSSLEGDGWLPDATWTASLDFVRRDIRNDQVIRRLEGRLSETRPALTSRKLQVLTEERDALGLALQAFDPRLRASVLRSTAPWGDPTAGPDAPFLMALRNSNLPEDLGIAHDASVFDGWIPIGVPALGATRFKRGGQALTVANVNRTGIENVLGVDLLYFQEEYHSFVFVQYKRMTREGAQPALYRPRGESYDKEYERMLDWDRRVRPVPEPSDLPSYRLGSDAFFFKLYANPAGAPAPDELLKGMYFPLSYWTSLLASPDVLGPRGGVQITYENAGRYLTNTDFVGLVEDGWVGTSPQSEKMITEVVGQSLDAGHSVTLAALQRA